MKKMIVCVFATLASLSPYAQTAFFTLGGKTQYPNIGISHKSSQVATGSYIYPDTAEVDRLFEELAKTQNPDNVVLVVEQNPPSGHPGKIFTDETPFITPKMRSLGYTKWIAADNRNVKDVAAFNARQKCLADQINRMYRSFVLRDSLGIFMFPKIAIIPPATIPRPLKDSMIAFLGDVVKSIDFENNLLETKKLVEKKGYIPVIIAGRAHVLALKQPCVMQARNLPSDKERIREICNAFWSVQTRNFVLEDFQMRYNLR